MIKKFLRYLDTELNKIPTNHEINALERRKAYFSAFFYSYVILCLGMAFFAQPLLKFADPALLMLNGIIVSFGLVCMYRAAVTSVANPKINKKLMFFFFFICTVTGVIISCVLLNDAIQNSIEHDSYCSNLQKSIMHNINAEKNSAIFNNMYCRLQYENSIKNNNDS
ncbi:hypothetical protein ABKV31_04520 [Enterobacter asburiae]|jgi:hypothetical protein|uniref:hypothetical protein n=1 Tax=Enterobacter asburiae TaxID=61645 RepID=UPI001C40C99E|nr:hypothetical protein [Enterobacter cloacae]